MEYRIFKTIVNKFLINEGFVKQGNYHYLRYDEIIIVIGIQKSNYSQACYINIGYIITMLNPSVFSPKDTDGDIRARFAIEINGKRIDLLDLENLSEKKLLEILRVNMDFYINGIESLVQLKGLLKANPIMLYQTKLMAKQMLGFE